MASPYDALLEPEQKSPYDALLKPEASPYDALVTRPDIQSHTADPNFDPVQHYSDNPSPDTLNTAREVFKQRAAQPTNYTQNALGALKGIGTGLVGGVKGLVKGTASAVSNIGTEISPFASEEDQQRAQRENAAALQLGASQGGDMMSGIWRNTQRLFGKTDRTLSDKEIEDQITHEAAHRAVTQDLTQGNVIPGGAAGHLGFNTVANNLTPEQLAAAGHPIDPNAVENESFLGNPSTYAIAPLGELAGPLINRAVTAPILKGAGSVTTGLGKVGETFFGHGRGILPAAAYAFHDPLSAVAGYTAGMAAKNIAPKIGAAFSEAGAEAAGALPPVGQSLATKAFKEGTKGAVTGAALSAPFVAAAQSPEEAGSAIGGGLGIGAVLGAAGGVKGSNQIETAAKFGQLANEGSQINYGLGWDDAHNRAMSTLSPSDQATINAYRARFNGFTDKDGIPIQIYAASGPDYAKAVADNGGGTASDTRGFISQDGSKVFVNADANSAPGKTNATLGHEAGGHLTEFLGDIAQKHDVATLQKSLTDALMPQGKPTPQFSAFIRKYAADLMKGGATKANIDSLDPQYFIREVFAEHAKNILNGQSIASFHLPKPLADRIAQGASDWLRSQGILPKNGSDLGWSIPEIKNITSQLRDVLYNQGAQSEAMRTARAEGEQSPSANYRIAQLEEQLKTPPTGASSVDEVNAYKSAQRELEGLKTGLTPKQQFPAAGQQPTAPAAPVAPTSPDAVTSDAMKMLETMKIPKTKAAAAIRLANQQHGSPIADASSLANGAFRITAGGTVKPGEFILKPAAPAQPVTVPSSGTFKDEQGQSHIVTGAQQGPPRVGDIVATREGQIRRITSIKGDTVDTARPIDPLSARGTLTHKLSDIQPLAHDYAPEQPSTGAPEETAKLTIKPEAGGFRIVDEAGNPINNTNYPTQQGAQQAIRQQGQGRFSLPAPMRDAAGNEIPDILHALTDQGGGGIHFEGMGKEERQQSLPPNIRGLIGSDDPRNSPDAVAQRLYGSPEEIAQGIPSFGDGTAETMFSLIKQAIESRRNFAKQTTNETARQKAETSNVQPATPTPDESIPPQHATAVAESAPTVDTPEPAPLSQADVERLSTEAEKQAVAAEKRGTTSKAAQKRIRHARIDSVVQAHNASLPANYQGIRLHIDPATQRETITGRIDPSRPFDAFLLKEAGLTPEQVSTLTNLQNNIGRTVKVTDYQSAPEPLGGNVTGEGRRTAQGMSTAQQRATGEAEAQSQDKTYIPLQVNFNKGKGDAKPSITVNGASPEKLLNNFNLAKNWIENAGFDVPYPDIHDPHFVADIKGGIRNHQAGYKFDGSAPVKGEPGTTPEEGYTPYRIEPTKAQFINLLFGDESAKTGPRNTPEQKAKQAAAVENDIPMTAEGETNPLRNYINEQEGPVLDRKGEPTTWSKFHMENPLSEALRTDLIHGDVTEPDRADTSLRPHGYAGDMDRFFSEGQPVRARVAAGFMPEETTAQTPKELAQDRIKERTAEPFYSQLTRTIKQLPQDTMTAAQARAAIEKMSKGDEQKLSGVFTDPLSPLVGKNPNDKVSKSDLTSYALEHEAKTQYVTLGNKGNLNEVMNDLHPGESYESLTDNERRNVDKYVEKESGVAPTHFSQYQLPGADEGSYREQFVTWPAKETTSDQAGAQLNEIVNRAMKRGYYTPEELKEADQLSKIAQQFRGSERVVRDGWKDGHAQYGDIDNPIVRIRRNIRTNADGSKTYFIEEMQGPSRENQDKMPPEVRKRIYEIGMKRALRDAVDEGADKIAWTTGDQQAERYDLSKTVDSIEWNENGALRAYKDGNRVLQQENVSPEKLAEYVGKDAASKLTAEDSRVIPKATTHEIHGEDLAVGGEGLKRLYDQTLPRIANDIAKKFGGKAGMDRMAQKPFDQWIHAVYGNDTDISTISPETISKLKNGWENSDSGGTPVHSLIIPDSLRDQQRGGNALFMPRETEGPTLDARDPSWIQRFEQLYQKDYRGTPLTSAEQDELDALQQRIVKQYGSLNAYDAQRKQQGQTDVHEPLREEMRKTPRQRARERLGFMPDDNKPTSGEPESPAGQAPSLIQSSNPNAGEVPSRKEDTGKPSDGETPAERLTREAEAAGLSISLETLKGLLRSDPQTMAKVRMRIKEATGKPAQFTPRGTDASPSSVAPRINPRILAQQRQKKRELELAR